MTEHDIEVVNAEHRDGDEWGFVADVRTRIQNPSGRDVVVLRTLKARPKRDDLTSTPEQIHEHAAYWWTESYISHGDEAFADSHVIWEYHATNDDELLETCVEAATHDPTAEIEMLCMRNDRLEEKLTNNG